MTPPARAGTVPREMRTTFVLALPLRAGHNWLALFIYLGGLSAASSMIIVETIALSVMVSNHLLLPLVLLVEVGLLGRISCFCRMRRGRKFMGWR